MVEWSASVVTRNLRAYHRWCVTRHNRAIYVQAAMERVDMTSDTDNVHKSVRPKEVKISEIQVIKLIDTFHQFLNPFTRLISKIYFACHLVSLHHKVSADLLK
jgi:hypothetical protein